MRCYGVDAGGQLRLLPGMEVSALRYSGGIGLHGRSPLLRLQSDERLITLVRRGNSTAFEVLVSRYHSRLLAFCRHLLSSKEDAEDVLQEVLTAAFNAMIADDRPINVRPWLYRIARNRCLNHLRRVQPVGVDSMDVHLSDHGASTADKVHMAEEFRILVGDIQQLPETQRTALVLREMDALSYDQIAEAMETTVPSVKSLLVRARLSLAEASEARLLTCEQVRIELAEVAEGLLPKAGAPVRRHLRSCQRCSAFQNELKRTSKALAALLPLGPLALLKQLAFAHLGHSAGAGAGSGASGASAAGTGAAVGSGAAAGGALVGAGAGGMVPLGLGALATKAAAGLAAAALVTAGAVEVTHVSQNPPAHSHYHAALSSTHGIASEAVTTARPPQTVRVAATPTRVVHHRHHAPAHRVDTVLVRPVSKKIEAAKTATDPKKAASKKDAKVTTPPGRTDIESVPTVLTNTNGTPPGGPGTQYTAGTGSTADITPTTTTTTTSDPSTSTTSTTSDPSTTPTTSSPTPTTSAGTTPPTTGGTTPPPNGGSSSSTDGTGTPDPGSSDAGAGDAGSGAPASGDTRAGDSGSSGGGISSRGAGACSSAGDAGSGNCPDPGTGSITG